MEPQTGRKPSPFAPLACFVVERQDGYLSSYFRQSYDKAIDKGIGKTSSLNLGLVPSRTPSLTTLFLAGNSLGNVVGVIPDFAIRVQQIGEYEALQG